MDRKCITKKQMEEPSGETLDDDKPLAASSSTVWMFNTCE